jgi:hypothetical protein
VLQQAVRECNWLHLKPNSHINVSLVHCHNAG